MGGYRLNVDLVGDILTVAMRQPNGSVTTGTTPVTCPSAAEAALQLKCPICDVSVSVCYDADTCLHHVDAEVICEELFTDIVLTACTDKPCEVSLVRRTPSTLLREFTSIVTMSIEANATRTICV